MGVWWKVAVLSLGGMLGVNARYWLSVWVLRWTNPEFPWPTFLINVSGCLAIGVASAVLAHAYPHPGIRLLIVVGFLGGYTTFSSYALEAVGLMEQGRGVLALIYLFGSVALGVAMALLGVMLGRTLRTFF